MQGRPLFPYRTGVFTTNEPELQCGRYPSFLSFDEVLSAENTASQDARLPNLQQAMLGIQPPPVSYAAERVDRHLSIITRERQLRHRQRRDAQIQELMSMPASQMTSRDVQDLQMA